MKIIKYVFLLVCLCNSDINSQVKKGVVIYKQRLSDNEVYRTDSIKNENLRGKISTFNDILKTNSGKLQYDLTFKDNESYFRRRKTVGENNREFAILLTEGNHEYYQDILNKKRIQKLNAFGEEFIIQTDMVHEWKLLNEVKKIDGYLCYKAIRFLRRKNQKDIIKKLVVAWYTPSIPFNFGPKGYGGLPGLILELNEGKLQYYVDQIIINPKEIIEIKKPIHGKRVTQKEFDEITTKMTRKWYRYKN